MLKKWIASQLKEINFSQAVIVNYIFDHTREIAFLCDLVGENRISFESKVDSLFTLWLSTIQVTILLEVVELVGSVPGGYSFVPTIYS